MTPGQGFAKQVALENLPQFAPLLRQQRPPGEAGGDEEDQQPPDPAYEQAEALFAGISLRITLSLARPSTAGRQGTPPQATPPALPPAAAPPVGATPLARGPVIWRKTLAASDVQRQAGNPTGGVRLTQARYTTTTGQRIDWTTYFRNDLFGRFPWAVLRTGRNAREGTTVEFSLEVLGQNWGTHRLDISHKPSGEAGQSNYTTILHWGVLSAQVRDANLARRQLTLYGPGPGTTEPFFIEIV